MKHFSTILLLVIVFLISTFSISFAQINWTKYPGNPVLDIGLPGAWNEEWVFVPGVLFDSTIYRMWYTGYDLNNLRIGYATSPDGINWTKYDDPSTVNPPYAESDPVMNPGDPGSRDAATVCSPVVIYDGNIHHMWSDGGDTLNPGMPWALPSKIGYASSPDGITWIKFNNPVLEPGTGNAWDGITIGGLDVIYDNNNYHMWYTGGGWDGAFRYRIGYATAQRNPGIINIPNDYPTIQAGINAAINGDTVLVADSTYFENINFKGKAITVTSHFYIDGDTAHISNTIIDGSNPSNPDSGSVVYIVSGEDTNSVLSGFTITGGSGTVEFHLLPLRNWRSGGGIYCRSGGRIQNNKIVQNTIVLGDSSFGGAIFAAVFADAYLIIENNLISSNELHTFSVWGGGMYIAAAGQTHVRLSNNRISGNLINAQGGITAGAGIACESNSTPDIFTIVGNTIINNQSFCTPSSISNFGIGMHFWNVSGKISKNIIFNNISNGNVNTYGVGSRLVYCDDLFMDRNTISMNHVQGNGTSFGGGIFMVNSSPIIQNNIISQNTASYGGGLRIFTYLKNEKYIAGNMNETLSTTHGIVKERCQNVIKSNLVPKATSVPVIINNTIVENNAIAYGGGIQTVSSNPIVINTIVWANQASSYPGIRLYSGSINVRYSDIQGGWSGAGNINVDPFFSGSVFNLADSSLCIGAGIDSTEIGGTWYYAPAFDYDGDPRPNPVDEYVDIGAQESHFPPTGIIKEDSDYLPKTFSLKQNYPNPFNPITTIEFSIPKTEFVTLKIYNLLGQEAVNLVSKKLIPGNYKYTWDASQYASGVYFYKLEAADYIKTRKLILLK